MKSNRIYPRTSPSLEGFHRLESTEETNLLPGLAEVGWTQVSSAEFGTMSPHTHESAYEFCYIVQGVTTWWVGDQIFEVEPGQIFMTHPGEPHGGMDEVLHPCEIYWVQIDLSHPSGLKLPAAELKALDQSFQVLPSRVCPATPMLLSHYQRLLDEHRFPDPRSHLRVRSLTHLLLLDILDAYQRNTAEPRKYQRRYSASIRRAVDVLADSLGGPPALDQAAKTTKLRPTQFRVRFKQETGFTPQEYFNRLRLRKAQTLLKTTSKSITWIAYHLGFNSSQHFASSFKKSTGLTPGQFRKRPFNWIGNRFSRFESGRRFRG